MNQTETESGAAAEVTISAPAAVIYDLVADVTRMGDWSPECEHCEWLDGATRAVRGARFVGRNRVAENTWTTTCEVVSADPGIEFSFAVIDGESGEQRTLWRYSLREADAATVVTESYEVANARPMPRVTQEMIDARRAMLREGMATTLAQLKAVAEAASTSG